MGSKNSKLVEGPRCLKGHPLIPTVRTYTCDKCAAPATTGLSLCCVACDYDVCPSHILAESCGAERDPATGVIRLNTIKCRQGHPLKLETRAVDWVCDLCGSRRAKGEISAFCQGCDYDECLAHRVMPEAGSAEQLRDAHLMTPAELEAAKMRSLLAAVRRGSERGGLAPRGVTPSQYADPLNPGAASQPRLVRRPFASVAAPDADAAAPPATGLATPIARPPYPGNYHWFGGISSSMWTTPSVYDAPYVSVTADPHSEAVFVKACNVEMSVCAFNARCTLTLTFANTSGRALEGEAVFPLPEQAVVCGYALEIDGEMVSATLLESKQAEKIYEAEVKKGVDPGLLEKVAAGGNTFKTRVYPLPANGTRRVSVTYVQPLDTLDARHGAISVSLAFARPVDVNVIGTIVNQAPPVLAGSACDGAAIGHPISPSSTTEATNGASTTPTYSLRYSNPRHAAANAVLRVVLPLPSDDSPLVAVEASTQETRKGWFFALSDVAPPPSDAAALGGNRRIAVLWDASLSRHQDGDVATELELLRAILQLLQQPAVEIFVVRNRVEALALRPGASVDEIVEALRAVALDGATSLQELEGALRGQLHRYDRILLFSDGQTTVGDGRVASIETGDAPPVFCITSATRFNLSHLQHYWAAKTGGAVLRVGSTPVQDLARAAATRSSQVFRVEGAVDVSPQPPISTAGSARFLITGRIPAGSLPAADGTVTVRVAIGYKKDDTEVREYSIRLPQATTDKAATGSATETIWAQQRIAELEVFDEANRDEILALGRQHGVVTASTSLLVLETLAQHLEHRVPPHPSRKAMYAEYAAKVTQDTRTEQDRVNAKISQVSGFWSERTSWFARTFDASASSRDIADSPSGMQPRAMACAAPRRAMAMSEAMDCCAAAAPMMMQRSRAAECESLGAAPGGAALSASSGEPAAARATATVKYWTPDTPYLRAIGQGATDAEQYRLYLEQRAEYLKTPAFYFDVGAFFLNPERLTDERRTLGIRVLSNIAELALDNSRVLRVLGYKLHESKEYDLASEVFCRVALWRPLEPQSYRDLGLTMLERGWYQTALELLWRTVTMEVHNNFREIEVEAIWEIRDCLARAGRKGVPLELPPLLQQHRATFLDRDMPLDLRVTMGWDQDDVDLDLHVIEPSGEEAYYGHKLTRTGGLMSRDFTRGYGPESYVIKRAAKGTYRFKTNYFASHMPKLTGPTVAILTITTNFLRPEQRTVCTLIRLNEAKANGEIGSVDVV